RPIALCGNAPAPPFGVVASMAQGAEDAGIKQAAICPVADVVEFEPFLLTALLAAVLGPHQSGLVDGRAELASGICLHHLCPWRGRMPRRVRSRPMPRLSRPR